jgi:hypothetical protein
LTNRQQPLVEVVYEHDVRELGCAVALEPSVVDELGVIRERFDKLVDAVWEPGTQGRQRVGLLGVVHDRADEDDASGVRFQTAEKLQHGKVV